jgi:hypothetical protein
VTVSNIPHSDIHTHTDTVSVLTDAVQRLLPPLLNAQAATLSKRKLETELEPHSMQPTSLFTELRTTTKIHDDLVHGNSSNQNEEYSLFRDIPIPIPKCSLRSYESDSSSNTVHADKYSEYFLHLDFAVHDEIPEAKNIDEDGNEEKNRKSEKSSKEFAFENNEKMLILVVNSISQIIRLNTDYELFLQKLETERKVRYCAIFNYCSYLIMSRGLSNAFSSIFIILIHCTVHLTGRTCAK